MGLRQLRPESSSVGHRDGGTHLPRPAWLDSWRGPLVGRTPTPAADEGTGLKVPVPVATVRSARGGLEAQEIDATLALAEGDDVLGCSCDLRRVEATAVVSL